MLRLRRCCARGFLLGRLLSGSLSVRCRDRWTMDTIGLVQGSRRGAGVRRSRNGAVHPRRGGHCGSMHGRSGGGAFFGGTSASEARFDGMPVIGTRHERGIAGGLSCKLVLQRWWRDMRLSGACSFWRGRACRDAARAAVVAHLVERDIVGHGARIAEAVVDAAVEA